MADEVVNAVAEPARVKFLKDRTKVVMLEYPFEYDGKLIDRVTIHRLTTAEVSRYYKELANLEAIPDLPMFDQPQAVIDAMDDDDSFALQQELDAFLPRRLQALAGSVPTDASESSGSSPTS